MLAEDIVLFYIIFFAGACRCSVVPILNIITWLESVDKNKEIIYNRILSKLHFCIQCYSRTWPIYNS